MKVECLFAGVERERGLTVEGSISKGDGFVARSGKDEARVFDV